ncbi:hypothetical protein L873DRAFT_1716740 [Choiromyces venosus 120613-1]|uniref:Uncharacterized protein n=1 Tax=Choiromyces venosus 120613-1 TaxID=1336337 RepID=A0A3N4IXN9_9PEZI|nr:hypothetical protein L873DRAFT_1716740 [Choiromyces venosus 120613-1]
MAPLSLTYSLGSGGGGEDNGNDDYYTPGNPSTSGILLVILVFSFFALVFTIITGWVWCVSAVEPTYYSVRAHRRGAWRTKRVVPFREWYRKRFNLPRTPSDIHREEHYARVLTDLRIKGWEGRVLRNGQPDDHRWMRPRDTKFWRLHGHRNSLDAFQPLVRKVDNYGAIGIPTKREGDWEDDNNDDGASVGYSPFTIPSFLRAPLRALQEEDGGGNGSGGGGGRKKRQRSKSLSAGSARRSRKVRRTTEELRSNSWGPRGSRSSNGRCSRVGCGLSTTSILEIVMEEGQNC